MKNIIPAELIENRIFLIRNRKVMLDSHLAELYGVSTKALNQAVKRNRARFPADFMFQLNRGELANWMSQSVISNPGKVISRSRIVTGSRGRTNLKSQFVTSSYGGRRSLPYAFTEQGVAMLSSVLNSERAIQVNIAIMRAFVKLKQILSTHKELVHKLEELERKIEKHDVDIQSIFGAIRQLMAPPPEKVRRIIGFKQL